MSRLQPQSQAVAGYTRAGIGSAGAGFASACADITSAGADIASAGVVTGSRQRTTSLYDPWDRDDCETRDNT